jgi:gluconolactonase
MTRLRRRGWTPIGVSSHGWSIATSLFGAPTVPETQQNAIEGVLAQGALIRKVMGGFTFIEGPIWHPTENWLVFSDIAQSIQYKWSEAAGLSIFRVPSNQANGNCFDRLGRIISCEHASSHLVIHDHGGKRVSVLASHHGGDELNSPNDVICDSKGRVWFGLSVGPRWSPGPGV